MFVEWSGLCHCIDAIMCDIWQHLLVCIWLRMDDAVVLNLQLVSNCLNRFGAMSYIMNDA